MHLVTRYPIALEITRTMVQEARESIVDDFSAPNMAYHVLRDGSVSYYLTALEQLGCAVLRALGHLTGGTP